ncbi:hypothetical protein [uncultured Brevundimonas sp.]|uniref:hypothetical protein n=1 Tax=uncultured Brevundimonas sp. TaxID=213418 RepID=UPI0030EDA14C|tara:strand:- start:449 stop:838 length:390 start_codon:yes stop_codon:yes gene_type:complete
MDRSRFLAALIGPTLAVASLSILLNRSRLADWMLAADPLFILMAGVITLPVGLAIVITHPVWRGWPTIITVFGWLAVLGGAVRILVPGWISTIAPHLVAAGNPFLTAGMAVGLLLGLVLSAMAFRAPRA